MSGLSFPPVYLPWSPYSMTPEEVQHLTSFIYSLDICHVLEVGAGVSTSCITWALMHQSKATSLRTIERDETWRKIADNSLLLVQEAFYSLGHSTHGHHNYLNADWASAMTYIAEQQHQPQMIVIDGPCAAEDPRARMVNLDPVSDLIMGRTRPMYVFIDDMNRPGEQALCAGLRQLDMCTTVFQCERYALLKFP